MNAKPPRQALPVLQPAATRAQELARDGWVRRFVAAPPRLDEMIMLYRSLGLEVTAEPLDQREIDADCAGCFTAAAASRVIFTRSAR
jgi:hypothetical protein